MGKTTETGGRTATQSVIPGQFALSVGHPNSPVPDGYEWLPLSGLARLESGHTPSRSNSSYWGGEIPWVGIRDATGNHGRRIRSTIQSITQLGLDNSSARLLPIDTVCLSRTASVGYVVTIAVPMATSQDFVNWVCGPNLSPPYLHYLLMLERESIRRFAHGTTHQTMYYPEAKALHVMIPDRRAQDAVAELLRALDDKMSVNTVAVAAADRLLAIRLMRELGTGARPVRLSDVADVNLLSMAPSIGSHLRYVDISSVGVGKFKFPNRRDWADAPGRARRGIRRGDTLWSTVRPNRRSHALNLSDDPELVGSTGLAVLTPRDVGFAYLYEVTHRPEFAAYLESVAEGSAYPAVRAERFFDAEIPLLPQDAREAFEAVAVPLREMAWGLDSQNRSLAALRDALLPGLMSGRIKVKDAEDRVGEVL
jgi:type I restriction enzyme, S subunit